MRIAYFDLTPELLAEFVFASGYHSRLPRAFFVAKNPLPSDAKIVKVRGSDTNRRVRVYVESASFDDVPEPVELPPILYQTVYGTDLNDLHEKLNDVAVLSADSFDL